MRGILSRLSAPASRATVGPIGVELGADRLRMLQLERHRGGLRVRARHSAPCGHDAAPDALRPLVREAWTRAPFRGRRIVTAMPDPDVKLLTVNYELRREVSEPELILEFVAERTGESLEHCVVDYRVLRASEQQTSRSALVAVARREAVFAQLERLRSAGLSVEALEITPIAIHRLVAWLSREASHDNRVLIHCGRTRSHLIALAGRRLDLYREVEFGADGLIESLAKALDLSAESAAAMLRSYGAWPDDRGEQSWDDPAKALEIAETLSEILKPCTLVLAEEIKRAGAYMASQWQGASLDRVCLLGAFAAWPRFDRLVESTIAMPTRVLDPLAGFPSRTGDDTTSESRRDDDTTSESRTDDDTTSEVGDEMSIAAGLALRGMTGDE